MNETPSPARGSEGPLTVEEARTHLHVTIGKLDRPGTKEARANFIEAMIREGASTREEAQTEAYRFSRFHLTEDLKRKAVPGQPASEAVSTLQDMLQDVTREEKAARQKAAASAGPSLSQNGASMGPDTKAGAGRAAVVENNTGEIHHGGGGVFSRFRSALKHATRGLVEGSNQRDVNIDLYRQSLPSPNFNSRTRGGSSGHIQ